MSEGSKMFSVMVVGENPEELMEKYDLSLEVEPYVKYEYKKKDKMRNNAIKVLSEMTEDPKRFGLSQSLVNALKLKLKAVSDMSGFEYYQQLVAGYVIDDNGDAISTENPQGKWTTFKVGKNFSYPLKLKNGTESYTAKASDVDWDSMHLQNQMTYDIVWDLVHGEREPQSDEEKNIYENMKDMDSYFDNFSSKEDYISYNCSYWNYGYLDENGWIDMDDNHQDKEWVASFFEKFVKPLKPDDKVTIMECSRYNSEEE